MTLSFCIQCTDKLSGDTGSFVYDTDKPFEAVSPVFPDTTVLFHWIAGHGYQTQSLANFELVEVKGTPLRRYMHAFLAYREVLARHDLNEAAVRPFWENCCNVWDTLDEADQNAANTIIQRNGPLNKLRPAVASLA